MRSTHVCLFVLALTACGKNSAPRDDGGVPIIEVDFGIEARVANATCHVPERPTVVPLGDYSLEPLFPNLNTQISPSDGPFSSPSPIVLRRVRMPSTNADPGSPGRVLPGPWLWFVGLRNGRVFQVSDPSTAAVPATSLRGADTSYDYSQSEGGLLGLAFDPDIATRPDRAHIYFTIANSGYVSLFRANVVPGSVYTTTGQVEILRTSGTGHHYGGEVLFGPDGYLYMSVGEGDIGARTRSRRNLRGKILRLDVHSTALTAHYGVPADNPSANNLPCWENGDDVDDANHDCPEVYARGFRNPFRMSFDREGGALWVGDVGTSHEEINLVTRDGDYGWNDAEGPESEGGSTPSVSEIPRTGCTGYGYAIIGGFVYRGSAMPSLYGRYVVADNDAGKLFVLENPYDTSRSLSTVYNGDCSLDDFHPASFTEDENGELYVVVLHPGTGRGLLKLVPQSPETPGSTGGPSPTLSGTGCFTNGSPIAAAIPYDLNSALWSDGLDKYRSIVLPDGETIDVEDDGDLTFPIGTVLIKEFAFRGARIETRLLMRHADGDWAGYTYVWNAGGTEAYLASGEQSVPLSDGGEDWQIPSRAQCLACHTSSKGRSLGPETRQLDRRFVYPGGRLAPQLATLQHIGVLPATLPSLTAFPLASDTSASVELRARAYLHTNCSHCHPGPGAKPNFLYDTPFASMVVCNEAPSSSVPGGTALLVPGDAAHSVITLRMHDTGMYRMPLLGSARVDDAGVGVVTAWIDGMTSCTP